MGYRMLIVMGVGGKSWDLGKCEIHLNKIFIYFSNRGGVIIKLQNALRAF